MQLPIDVKALANEATNIDEALKTPLSVSVYLDEDAPADVASHVRAAFSSTLPTVRLTVTYLDATFAPNSTNDMAVVVAGPTSSIGAAVAALRAAGVPTMVVTTLPAIVAGLAREAGHPIPDGDLVSPIEGDYMARIAEEPYKLDDAAAAALDLRMGRWIVSACHAKRLAFSVAFPFVRRPLATDAVMATAVQNAGVGLVPLIPGADMPVMTLNQAKMVLQIAAAYGQPMSKDRVKEVAPVVASAFASRAIARELITLVPGIGWIVRPGIGYSATVALGYAMIEYFEGGKDLQGVASVISRATTKGKQVADLVRGKLAKANAASAGAGAAQGTGAA